MDYGIIKTFINELGFPILACVYMAYSNHKISQTHKEEISILTSAINKLKDSIDLLLDRSQEGSSYDSKNWQRED